MIIHVIGLEGCGHHGIEPIFEELIKYKNKYIKKDKLHEICNLCCENGNYINFENNAYHYLRQHHNKIFFIDDSYPSGRNRNIDDQWNIVKLYDVLSKKQKVILIHLKRNMINSINSHPTLDGGIFKHAEKLCKINRYIEDNLKKLKEMGVDIIEINYENINSQETANKISKILDINSKIVYRIIENNFKLSKKDYSKLLNKQTILKIEKILNDE